jgi:galactonate dehydratase
MRITKIETFKADGGWRRFGFVKTSTDEGIVGWSEFAESFWSPGLSDLIERLGQMLVGEDPGNVAVLSARLHSMTRLTAGGFMHQAIAAIENACLDVKAKALGVPVYALFGGAFRRILPLYWSHFGTFRARYPAFFETDGTPPLRSLDGFKALGAAAAKQGYRALKINPMVFGDDGPQMLNPGFGPKPVEFSQNFDRNLWSRVGELLDALREGVGKDVELMIDLNFGLKTEGQLQAVRQLALHNLRWIELDGPDPASMARVRAASSTPLASLESMHGLQAYNRFFEHRCVDVAIIDTPWNGYLESYRIASAAAAYDLNIAPHNFCGHLYTMINAHLAAAIPNFSIMEYEVDDVAWRDELFTSAPVIEDGALVLSDRPGWGVDVCEEALERHPPR